MRFLPRLPLLAILAALALVPAVSRPAAAAANHVVISEFATRGLSSAFDEFCELYNPTLNAIDMSGWSLQYKSATGTTWNSRGTLPAGSIIQPHGFFLIAPSSGYSGPAVADFSSAAWSGNGISDTGGHLRIIDLALAPVDKVGWGTAIDAEGGHSAPTTGVSPTNNSIERKASATSNANSLAAGGSEEKAGNGQDTDDNAADFVGQSNGRNPQNTGSPPEPVFASGGNGTGRARIATATIVYSDRPIDFVTVAFAQDSAYTLTTVALQVPSAWTWSHSAGDVSLGGSAFASATASVAGDTVFVTGAALTTADSGSVSIANLNSPTNNGSNNWTVRTAVAAGTPALIVKQPSIRVLKLVPIVALHVNDAQGVCTAPYQAGAEATVTGVVTANLSDVRTDVYIQDGTGGVDIFNGAFEPTLLSPGDSITVTGSITQFRGLTEITADFSLLTIHATGRPVPDPVLRTCADVNATMKADYTEPDEGRLVRVNGVTYNATNSTITDATGTTTIFFPNTWAPPPAQFDLIGILKQYKPGTPAPGPPYLADYEVNPRTPDDIIAHPGPVILTTPYEDQITASSVRLNWTTNTAATSIVYYGTTPSLGDSVVDAAPVTTHALAATGLQAATLYYYSVGSEDANGRNFSPVSEFITAAPPQATEQVNVYFNHSVDTSVAWTAATVAKGNYDFTSKIVSRIDNAKRSLDACFYNLSGTSGNAIATALVNAKNRGVRVRAIAEYDNSTNSGFTTIKNAGIPFITDKYDAINNGNGLMHDKFLVVDGRGGGAPDSQWVWTGSWNPTDPGTNDDYQNVIEIQDPSLALVYTMEFNEMWGSATDAPNASVSRFGQRKLDDTPHRFVIGGRNVQCYFSPSDGTNSKLLAAINAAQHAIGFELLTMTRADLSGALIAQKNAGLAVRGDLDNGTDTNSQYAALQAAGVDVRLNNGSGLLHHKYMLCDYDHYTDDALTVTGSHNWSNSAEDQNNENTLFVHDFAVTNQYLQEMSARYTQFGGTNPVTLGVDRVGDGAQLSLAQNAPNPSLGRTSIAYAIPRAEKVELGLFDVQGRKLQSIVNGVQQPGKYRVDLATHGMKAGVYFYRLKVGAQTLERKMLLLK